MNKKFSNFWQILAKKRLSEAEAQDVYRSIVQKIENNVAVREGKLNCQKKKCMDPRYLLRRSTKRIQLTSDEDADVRGRIVAYMREHPLPENVRHQPIAPSSYMGILFSNPFRTLKPVPLLASFVFISAFVFSLLFASQIAIPGDLLYPIKIHLVEQTTATLHFSIGSRTEFELERLVRRLEEATQLAATGRMVPATKQSISEQITMQLKRIKEITEILVRENSDEEALYVHSKVESLLLAHAVVLGSFLEESEEKSKDVEDFLSEVTVVEKQVKNSRVNSENKFVTNAHNDAEGSAAAERSMQLAANRIGEAEAFLDAVGPKVASHIVVQAKGRIDYARRMFAHARYLIDSKHYEQAIRTSGESIRASLEAKSILRLSTTLNSSL